jgi:hypothetical protein
MPYPPVPLFKDRKNPFVVLREEAKKRHEDPNHPSGHLNNTAYEAYLVELDKKEAEEKRLLAVCSRFVNVMFGITKDEEGVLPEDFTVLFGEIASDGKRATFIHVDAAVSRELAAHGSSMRVTDAFQAPASTRMNLAVLAFERIARREDGTRETHLDLVHLPLDIVAAIHKGWLKADIKLTNGEHHMAEGRDSADCILRCGRANVTFRRNERHSGPDFAMIGRHPDSGKTIFARRGMISADKLAEGREIPGVSVGVVLAERPRYYEVVSVLGAPAPKAVTDAEWKEREAKIAKANYFLDLRLGMIMARNHVRVGPYAFDAKTVLGIAGEVTREAVEKSSEGELAEGAERHITKILFGKFFPISGVTCRVPPLSSAAAKAWAEAHKAELVKAAAARLVAILDADEAAAKAEAERKLAEEAAAEVERKAIEEAAAKAKAKAGAVSGEPPADGTGDDNTRPRGRRVRRSRGDRGSDGESKPD